MTTASTDPVGSRQIPHTNPGTIRCLHALVTLALAVVTGQFSSLPLHGTPPALDTTFQPNVSGAIYPVALQPDGKILIGGQFTTINGTQRRHLARLTPDGSLDATLNLPIDGMPSAIAVQADGGILVGGSFSSVGGQSFTNLMRIRPDGSPDSGFIPHPDGQIQCITIQSDGRVLVGGSFTTISGTQRNRIARFHQDGSLDTSFNPSVNGTVNTFLEQPDGKILVGGQFSVIDGTPRIAFTRLNANGSTDTDFTPIPAPLGASVSSFVVQPDGRILMGGQFSNFGGTGINHLVRLQSNGTLDPVFNPGFNSAVYSLALQADGSILAGGAFNFAGAIPRNRVARLLGDGSVDPSYNPDATGLVFLAPQLDGNSILAGDFFSLGTVFHANLARVSGGVSSTSLSIPDATRIQWSRSGAVPELTQVGFSISTDNGLTWSSLGNGSRTSTGWELQGLSLPATGWVRAQARLQTAYNNGSSSLIETRTPFTNCIPKIVVRGKSVIITGPDNTPSGNDDTAFFEVGVCGASAAHVFQILNTSACPVTILAISSSVPSEFITSPIALPATIASGSWLDLPVTFDPINPGPLSALISIESSATPAANPLRFNLSGVGTPSPAQVTLSCPTNKTVLCGASWDFDPPSAASALGPAPAVTIAQTITNSLCPTVITRTWQTVDACGNTAVCSQSVTIATTAAATLNVPGNANIFGAGLTTSPNPGGQGAGILPILHSFNAGPGQVLTFPSVSGIISMTTNLASGGPDGYSFANLPTAITSYGGISGIKHDLAGFLVGVFLDDNGPAPTAPPILDFRGAQVIGTKPGTNFTQLTPLLGQTFFIGDGLTSNGAGTLQQFLVPPTATRLFLGFADGAGYHGLPGVYQDNDGSFLVNLVLSTDAFRPTDKVVSCEQRWTFDPPVLANSCDPVVASSIPIVVSTVTVGTCPRTSTRTWQWSDACGNVHSTSQMVTLIDTVKPTIRCPDRRVVTALNDKCQLIIPALRPEASDNCTPASDLVYSQSPSAGSIASGLCQAVTVVVSDSCGNSSECTITVCGEDLTPPHIFAPARVTAENCLVPNILSQLNAVDNCTASSDLILTQAPPAGTLLGPGTTAISVTATDSSGNTTSALIPIQPAGNISFLDQLYNTGVDTQRAALPNSAIDPHYSIVSVPVGTPTGPGAFNAPSAKVGPGFLGLPPFSTSRWINPSGNNLRFPPGFYVFTQQFVLPANLDPGTASISGRWSADMGGKLFLNGSPTPSAVIPTPTLGNYWSQWNNFTISTGFLPWPATNTLSFAVESLSVYPALRVEFTSAFATCTPCSPPVILLQSPDLTRPRLGSATFTATVWGSPQLGYQWFFNGSPLTNNPHFSGVNSPNLTIAPLHYGDAGIYHLVISNSCGQVASRPRKLTVTKGWGWPWEEWIFHDLTRPLSGVLGRDLSLRSESPLEPRQSSMSIGSIADWNLPPIGGQIVNALHMAPTQPEAGLQVPQLDGARSVSADASSPPQTEATFIMDLMVPSFTNQNSGANLSFFSLSTPPTDSPTTLSTTRSGNSLVLRIDSTNRLHLGWSIGSSQGTLTAVTGIRGQQWNRLALTLGTSSNTAASTGDGMATLYLNGQAVGAVEIPNLSALITATNSIRTFFASYDDASVSFDPGSAGIYLAGIQYHLVSLSPDLIASFGSPENGSLSRLQPASITSNTVAPRIDIHANRTGATLRWNGVDYLLEETTDAAHGPWTESYLPFSQCCDPAPSAGNTDSGPDGTLINATATIDIGVPGEARYYRLRSR